MKPAGEDQPTAFIRREALPGYEPEEFDRASEGATDERAVWDRRDARLARVDFWLNFALAVVCLAMAGLLLVVFIAL